MEKQRLKKETKRREYRTEIGSRRKRGRSKGNRKK
jgi:hypothetical protein